MTNSTLDIDLLNNSSSATVYAYVTGLALNNGNRVFLLQADGKTAYYPTSPTQTTQPLQADCGIQLGGPGTTRRITIPQLAGGRIWFCLNDTLTFLLNPGPGLVEPSVSNPSDPNYSKSWAFCEFTFNSAQAFVNISYVDFVALPISLALQSSTGTTQTVPGIPTGGLQTIADALVAQHAQDGQGWDQLVVRSGSQLLRALSPNTGIVMNAALFAGYYDAYVDAVWARYGSRDLKIDTQARWGTLAARVANGLLTFDGVGSFAKPAARDVFSCSSGPFTTGNDAMGALTARLAAGFNRSTLLLDEVSVYPDAESVTQYYQHPITNHYSRIVHATEAEGRGYAFPYDDVGPSGGVDQSGSVSAGDPVLLTVGIGSP